MQRQFLEYMVDGFNDGNERMRTRWYESYYPELVKKAYRFSKGSPDAPDLAMEAVEKLLSRQAKFETVKNINSYVEKILFTVCREYMKKQDERRSGSDGLADHYQYLTEEAMKKADNRALFMQLNYMATEMLPAQCKQVFHLAYHEGMKNQEIAKCLGIAVKTVESHKHFAIKKLKLAVDQRVGGNLGRFLFVVALPFFLLHLFIQKISS